MNTSVSSWYSMFLLPLLMLIFSVTVSAEENYSQDSATLRILSYNILHGHGMDGKVDLSRAAALIKRLKPDLVALQEIDKNTERTRGVDQAKELGRLTGMHHAFGSFFDFQGGEYGMAILSKKEPKAIENHRLPDGREPRTSLAVTVTPIEHGPEIVFVDVHFYATEEERLAQAKRLLEVLEVETRPVILAGDFNSRPGGSVMKLFAGDWTIPDKGEDRFTHSSVRPNREIDHILFRAPPGWKVKKIDVLDEPVISDHRPVLLEVTLPLGAIDASVPLNKDWPTWRGDALRSSATDHELPSELHLHWSRDCGQPRPAFPDEVRLNFDETYEPVVGGGLMFVPSMNTDSVAALDTKTGQVRWRYYCGGPIRFAPVAHQGKVYAVSDDGFLHCIDAQSGQLIWKFNGTPSSRVGRRLLGNGRMIARWPARGGPALVDGVVYFAAGIFPFEGVAVYAIDAESGKAVWKNLDAGHIKDGFDDHGGFRDGGLSPQGYLTVTESEVIVPSGRDLPLFFDRQTGEMLPFKPAWGGRRVLAKGCWYVAANNSYYLQSGDLYDLTTRSRIQLGKSKQFKELGEFRDPILTDTEMIYSEPINEMQEESYRPVNVGFSKAIAFDLTRASKKPQRDRLNGFSDTNWQSTIFEPSWQFDTDLRAHIQAGDRIYAARPGKVAAIQSGNENQPPKIVWQAEIEGDPARLLAADDRLFVVTLQGRIHCFAAKSVTPRTFALAETQQAATLKGSPQPEAVNAFNKQAAEILERSSISEGYCLALGIGTGELIRELAEQSQLHIIAIETDVAKVESARRRFDSLGLYGHRVHVLHGDLSSLRLPAYFASLAVSEDLTGCGWEPTEAYCQELFGRVQPHGGTLCLPKSRDFDEFAATMQKVDLEQGDLPPNTSFALFTRPGPATGAADWTHESGNSGNTYASEDTLLKGSLGVLWFGGSIDRIFPQWDFNHSRGPSPLVCHGRMFLLIENTLHAVDAYTGRLLWKTKLPEIEGRRRQYRHDNYVATPDRLYVVCGRECLVLDAKTGASLSRFVVPHDNSKLAWKQIRIWNDLFFGATDSDLYCLDRHTGELHWKHTAGTDHLSFAVGGGGVFVGQYALEFEADQETAYEKIIALDARQGNPLWDSEIRFKRKPQQEDSGRRRQPLPLLQPKLTYGVQGDLLLITVHDRTLGAFEGKTGTLLWNKPVIANDPPSPWSTPQPPILRGDLLITHGGQMFESRTGKKMDQRLWFGMNINMTEGGTRGCGRAVACQHLLTVRDAHASYFDLSSGEQTFFRGIRSGCTNNLIPAAGLLSAPNFARGCSCNYSLSTSMALAPMPEASGWSAMQDE